MTKIEQLAADVLIATNSGTFGAAEACRKVGTGDQAFATRNVYQRLDGTIYATGPNEDDAPGRMRRIDHDSPASRRQQIENEEKRIAADAKKKAASEREIEDLNRGWDGYQFIGIEAGKSKLAAILGGSHGL